MSWHDLNPAGRMAAMREELIISAPFFGALFASQDLVARESIGTAAVNGKALTYAPSFVAGLSELQCLGVGVHETLHLALMQRRRPPMAARAARMRQDARRTIPALEIAASKAKARRRRTLANVAPFWMLPTLPKAWPKREPKPRQWCGK